MTLRDAVQYAAGAAILLAIVMVATGVRVTVPVVSEFLVTMVLAAIAAFVGIGMLHYSGFDLGAWWRPTDTEAGHRVPVPGDELAGERERAIEDRVRQRAIVSIADARGCSTATARRLVNAGEWTDDRYAAAYLAGRDFSIAARIVATLRGESLTDRARARAIEEIRRIRGEA